MTSTDSGGGDVHLQRWVNDGRVRTAFTWTGGVLVFYLVQQLLWPAPFGVVLHGVEIGGLVALVAFGLVLVYRANKIINFAQADLGGPPTVLGFLLMSQGWPFWPALVVALVVGTLIGLWVQAAFMRMFFRSPRLVATVATIGISQLLQGVSALLPQYLTGKKTLNLQNREVAFPWTFHVHPVLFNGNDVLAMIAVPVMSLGLMAFLRYSHAGVAIRASADNADRASLLGIDVMRIQLVVWAVAGVLATVGVFLTASVEGVGLGGQFGGPDLLVQTLAAAVIGRMERFGTIFVAAAGLGVLEQAILWHTSSSTLVDPVCFLVIVGALLLQRRGSSSRQLMGSSSTWQTIGNVRPAPAIVLRLPEVVRARRVALGLVGGFALVLPWILGPGKTNLACLVLIYAILATSLVILTGWAGQMSLGQFGFMGIGAGVGAAISVHWHWDLVWIVVAAGLAGAVGAMVIGIPALRIQGLLLAVTTLAFAVVVGSYLLNPEELHWLPSADAFLARPAVLGRAAFSERAYYNVCLAFLLLAVLAVVGIRHSRTGRALMAVRDNAPAAESFGINQMRAKLTAFAVSGFLAAAAGALFVFNQNSLDASQFQPADSLGAFAMVVVGGLGSITGGVIGAVYLNGIQWFQDIFPSAVRPAVNFLAAGTGLLLVLQVMPSGLADPLYRLRDQWLGRAAARHGLHIEALMGASASASASASAPVPSPRRTVLGAAKAKMYSQYRASWLGRRQARGAPPVVGVPLLCVEGLEAGYDGVQILFGVDASVEQGEIVALLGTNGAGKSTLLRGISGLLPPRAGRVLFEGRDLTGIPSHKVAAMGLVQMPGGRGVFPSLTVAENMRIAGWLTRRDRAELDRRTAVALDGFPVLRHRLDQPAVNLSGGEQQMLMLAQTMMMAPRLVMIDELSLGLAPAVVESLVRTVREMRDRGITFILVEQSVNVALTISNRAYFLEKGEVRFQGDAADLLERPDVLRSVFIAGASADGTASANGTASADSVPAETRPRRRTASKTAAARAVLEVERVSRSYGGIRAVADVSLTLHDREIVGIIGPNGAGKTSLFDLIGGSTAVEDGRILLDGVDLTPLGPDVRALMGMGRSFQDARLFPGLTAAETIAVAFERTIADRDPLAAALHLPVVAASEAAVARKVDELIELLGLGDFRDKFISELSTGSRRVVDLACTLAHRPSVLLLDEPSSGIAQRETEALAPFIRRIRDETGCAILIIEHDMPLISSVADRLIAMELGSVVVEGRPADVLKDERVITSYLGTSGEIIARSGAVKKRKPRPKVAGGVGVAARQAAREAPSRGAGRSVRTKAKAGGTMDGLQPQVP